MEDIDGDDTGEETDEPGEHNEPPVMLSGQACKDTKHGSSSHCYRADE
jgi:hypothetical protein